MKALSQMPLPESEKKAVAEKALARESSCIRLQRIKMKLEDYELLDMIGKGAFGEVRLARCKGTGIYNLTQAKL